MSVLADIHLCGGLDEVRVSAEVHEGSAILTLHAGKHGVTLSDDPGPLVLLVTRMMAELAEALAAASTAEVRS